MDDTGDGNDHGDGDYGNHDAGEGKDEVMIVMVMIVTVVDGAGILASSEE